MANEILNADYSLACARPPCFNEDMLCAARMAIGQFALEASNVLEVPEAVPLDRAPVLKSQTSRALSVMYRMRNIIRATPTLLLLFLKPFSGAGKCWIARANLDQNSVT
jgi:hypothetical protein